MNNWTRIEQSNFEVKSLIKFYFFLIKYRDEIWAKSASGSFWLSIFVFIQTKTADKWNRFLTSTSQVLSTPALHFDGAFD